MVIAFAGYILAYKLYGKFLGQKIFNLSNDNKTPAVELEDGKDYVPTKKGIIFGHHFTSIAGTGPIVGPAIGVIWGWLPALIWVLVGTIVMGAVHDFGALVISLRNKGKSISEYTSKYANPRMCTLFFLIVLFELWIVIAIFGLIIAIIFSMYPQSVFPVWCEIPIAILLGYIVYKKGGNVLLFSILAVLFGAVNQTLAGLALIVITLYLKTKGGLKFLISGIPCVFMVIMTSWALVMNQVNFINQGNILLFVSNAIILAIVAWLIIEGVLSFFMKPKIQAETA